MLEHCQVKIIISLRDQRTIRYLYCKYMNAHGNRISYTNISLLVLYLYFHCVYLNSKEDKIIKTFH